MPKSKTTKAKSTTKPAKNKTEAVPPSTTNQTVSTEERTAAKPAAAKAYRSMKPHVLTNQQKAGLAKHIMSSVGNLLDYKDEQFGDENLVGIDRRLMAEQLSAWVSYLPGSFWDSRLPQPNRARGRRQLSIECWCHITGNARVRHKLRFVFACLSDLTNNQLTKKIS